jgi:hypothetical protein
MSDRRLIDPEAGEAIGRSVAEGITEGLGPRLDHLSDTLDRMGGDVSDLADAAYTRQSPAPPRNQRRSFLSYFFSIGGGRDNRPVVNTKNNITVQDNRMSMPRFLVMSAIFISGCIYGISKQSTGVEALSESWGPNAPSPVLSDVAVNPKDYGDEARDELEAGYRDLGRTLLGCFPVKGEERSVCGSYDGLLRKIVYYSEDLTPEQVVELVSSESIGGCKNVKKSLIDAAGRATASELSLTERTSAVPVSSTTLTTEKGAKGAC